jgi:hypothetical protein
LYYTKNEEKARLWKSLVDGSGETPVLDNVAQRGFVVTPDRIYYLRAEADRGTTLRYRVLATGQDVEISSIQKKGYPGLSLSADGKYLIYSQSDYEGSDLMLVSDFSSCR